MITDLDLADLCVGTYNYPGVPAVMWDISDYTIPGCVWFMKHVGDVDVVAFEGSHDLIGWRKNFDAWAKAETYRSNTLDLHPGFYSGLPDAWSKIQKLIGPRVVITGHSRGAAQAADLACLMLIDDLVPEAVVGFGEPKSGYKSQADLLAKVPYQRIYRNGNAVFHDVVTDVAYTFPNLPYQHRAPLTLVTAKPPPGHELGMFAWHHCVLYAKALESTS